ncbi:MULTISPECIES: DUF3105 domain-containing protein [Nocardiopsis]|uniref:DUF3105 domain-containing protein n=1 Tax=Nocardiopsis sinuspersici TaxID=501010 RepID=A0A1V3C776_9ACTN|nr:MULTISPECIES: DUF3105 domain-containing protein [Nocardiopsis]OOC56611.1 hypothetical protein NOSIN_24580 [Nocardiopsis sinuspersici]
MPPTGPQGPHGPHGAYPYQPPQKRSGAGTGLIIGAVLLVFVLMAGGGAVAFWTLSPDDSGTASAEGIGTVRQFSALAADHVDEGETVEYEVYPPAGGPHYPVWQDCGVYGEPLRSEYVVHSMEHGAVWITYDPGLSEADVQILRSHYSPGDYLVISPAEDLPAPVVASAWGSQIRLEDPADPRLVEYLVEYVRGENTPEPGAACSGGRSGTGTTGTGTGAVGAGIDASEFTG